MALGPLSARDRQEKVRSHLPSHAGVHYQYSTGRLRLWNGSAWEDLEGKTPGGAISPEYFGAKAGGVEDATAALNAALASGASIIDGSNRRYKVTGTLNVQAGQTLRNIELDASSFPGSGAKRVLSVSGAGVVDTASVPGNVAEGAQTVTVAAGGGSKFASGDYVLLSSEQNYPYTGATVKRGEIKRVRSVSGDVVSFREATYEGYAVASGEVKLHKLSMKEDVTLDGVKIKGVDSPTANMRGVEALWTKGLTIRNCVFEKIDTYCAALTNCLDFNVSNNRMEGVFYSGEGVAFYGIVVFNCCQWGVIHGNTGEEVRHLVTTSSSVSHYGQPYHITVTSNAMHNAMSGVATDSWAYENHGFGRWIVWDGNVADGCRVGFNLEKGDQVVTNNVVRNFSMHGIYCDDGGQDIKNLLISGNLISGPSAGTAATRHGIRIEADALSARENIKIQGNIINLLAGAGYAVRGVFIGAGAEGARNCAVEGNTITREGAAPYNSNEFGIRFEQGAWTAQGNGLLDFERAVYSTSGETKILNNRISKASPAGVNASAVELVGSYSIVAFNTFIRMNRAVAVGTGTVGNVVVGNIQQASTNPALLDNGSGTVKALLGNGF